MFFQPVNHYVVVIAGFEIVKYMFDFAVSVDQEADAVNTIVGFAHEGLLSPDAELLAHLVILIRQKRKVEQLFFRETEEFFGFISADTQHINTGFFNSSMLSRKPQACTVQPGVMAFG